MVREGRGAELLMSNNFSSVLTADRHYCCRGSYPKRSPRSWRFTLTLTNPLHRKQADGMGPLGVLGYHWATTTYLGGFGSSRPKKKKMMMKTKKKNKAVFLVGGNTRVFLFLSIL